MFLEISQNSQENTCARDSLLIKLQEHHFYPEESYKFRKVCRPEHSRKRECCTLWWMSMNITCRE